MSKFKFRIGAKLGFSAGIGVLLVGAMLTTQMIGGSSVANSSADAIAQRSLSQIATDIKASARGEMLGVRDLRLSQNTADADKALAYLQARDASVVKFAAEALTIVRLPENRERLEKVKKLSNSYAGIGKEIGTAKSEIFAITARRQDNGDAWRKQYDAADKAMEDSKFAKAGEIVKAMREVAAAFDDARTAGWRFAATGE